jgi:hypothetical protein
MEAKKKRRAWKDRLAAAYWIVVGVFGFGRPVVDRRAMFGDDPRNDPYSLEYEPQGGRR